MSLSRFNHWLPQSQAHPEVVQGTTEFHHEIADAFFPQKGLISPQRSCSWGVRWYVAYPLSTRHGEALLLERGVEGAHSPMNRWVIKDSSQLEEALHWRKRPVWTSGRMDET